MAKLLATLSVFTGLVLLAALGIWGLIKIQDLPGMVSGVPTGVIVYGAVFVMALLIGAGWATVSFWRLSREVVQEIGAQLNRRKNAA